MKNRIIAISRECGSGGDEIAFALGQMLNIPVYEKAPFGIGFHGNGMVPYQKERPSMRYEGFLRSEHNYYTPATMFQIQSQEIRRLAAEGDCIILGRCADWVLRDADVALLRVFITTSKEDCIQRVMQQGETAKIRAKKTIRQINLLRLDYYGSYTGQRWSAPNNYDLFLDASVIGIQGCIEEILKEYHKPFTEKTGESE